MSGKKYQDREYQIRIVQKAFDYYQNFGNVMVESPTGSGKTVMGMKILQMLVAASSSTIDEKIVWVTMRRNLLRQAADEMAGLGFNFNIEFETIFAKSYPKAGILVVDEAQHDATSSMSFVHKSVKPKKVLGLTATPFRTDKLTLIFEKIIRDIGIQQLIRLGFLSQFDHYCIPNWKPETVTDHYLMDVNGYGQSVMFFHKYEDCLIALERLSKAGIRCDVVTADTDRDAQLERFEGGDLDVLINMMVLTEGFDYPNLKSVFVRDSVKLPTIQMGGRVLRTSSVHARKRIIQSTNTKFPFQKIATPVEAYHWDRNQWLALKANEKMDEIALQSAQSLLSFASPVIPTKQPKWSGK
jgi:superfamily II DNA or RNA helicase